ncbi:neutral ceramidase B-like [Haliotis cracherodii]|uniref:neutral ceramidase B-like n=1 Tax=Haliotis cracherodii TaxID=6455 RepID=UPI0039ED1EDD
MAADPWKTCVYVLSICCCVWGLVSPSSDGNDATNFLIGTGIGDITGPAAEVNMMGYANPSQTSNGIHLRQYSRAFVFADSGNKTRTVFVSTDSCMVSEDVKLEVVKRLRSEYGSLYTERNLCISGIHTHSGPAGFHQYLLFEITSLGFVNQSFVALVDGIVDSIRMAHSTVRPGNIFINSGELLNSNINRSPAAYANNPEAERKRYKYNVDKNMTVLKMLDAEGKDIGMISWFAVHCTSMNNTNGLISGDNKGYASQLAEEIMNNGAQPGKGAFVAAFAQSNEGDVSPNTKGPHCIDSGLPCDILTSTCHGKNELCVAAGPGRDMFESTKIIGENQYNKAMELYHAATIRLSGPVDFRHTYVDMTDVDVAVNGTTVKTCKPAMGYSFAAGTTDGPGMFDFKQGSTSSNPFWNLIRDFIKTPTPDQVSCHAPKPILLDTGEISWPYPWQPAIVDVQILRLGQLAIIAVPAEFSTMSGRRTRDAVAATLVSGGFPQDTVPIIAGLSNTYADYVATFEEYQVQRYEGASTTYGPHTLQAYIQTLVGLAQDMTKGTPSPPGSDPPNLLDRQLSFLPPVIFDAAPAGKTYGDVVVDVQQEYKQNSTVTVSFISGDPRNALKRDETFLTVERQRSATEWDVIFTDSSRHTRFYWHHTNYILGESEAEVTWNIPASQEPGTYRIKHFGDHKNILGAITAFSGTSSSFQVKAISK